MKITTKITNNGIKREVNFQGATLPNGRSIDGILNENEKLKQDVDELKRASSILTKIIPNKKIRDIVEIISLISLAVSIIFGIIQILT